MWKNESPTHLFLQKKVTQYTEALDQLTLPLTLYTLAPIWFATPCVVANSIAPPSPLFKIKNRRQLIWHLRLNIFFETGVIWKIIWKVGYFGIFFEKVGYLSKKFYFVERTKIFLKKSLLNPQHIQLSLKRGCKLFLIQLKCLIFQQKV